MLKSAGAIIDRTEDFMHNSALINHTLVYLHFFTKINAGKIHVN